MKKRCYYEILDVDRKATTSDIKQNYRKMALKYHPDKNDGEQAKQLFIQIQEAYQVLSDPNERTWYDNNRQKILFDKDSMTKQDLEMHTFGFNIWEYFSPGCYRGYQDAEDKNFYKVYRQVFQRIKQSERQAYQNEDDHQNQFRVFEGFGVSNTNLEKVLKFYEDWDNMTTYKSFVWKEEWDTKQAPNRWVRREMEKENKKERQKERKFYIKTVKDLISYLKKRDPRYQNYLMELNEKEKKKEQEKKVRLQQQKRFKQEQKQVKKQLQEQRLREVEQYYQKQGAQNSSQQQTPTLQKSHEEEFYCEVCEKGFKSQNQLNNHNNSKIHKQNLKLLMSEVVLDSDKKEIEKVILKAFEPQVKPVTKKESKKVKETKVEETKIEVEVVEKPVVDNSNQGGKKKKKNKKKKQYELSSEEEIVEKPEPVVAPKKVQVKKQPESDQESSQDDFMNAMLKNRGKINKTTKIQNINDSEQEKKKKPACKPTKTKAQETDSDQQPEPVTEKTLGKAKQKRLKKQEKQQEEKDKFKCTVCKDLFLSKTKLFTHINQTGHATPKK